MSDPKPPRSKRFQWRLECLGHALLEGAVGHLPGPLAYQLGEWMAGIIWHFMPRRREIILRNLRIAFGSNKELAELESMAKESFRRSGGNLVSAARTARLKPEQLSDVLEVENPELMAETLAKGKGVVLLLSHMGNWELLSRLVHLLPKGTQTGAFYRPLNNEIMNQQVLKRREADGTRMFSKRDPFHQVCSFLRNGGLVGILADQRVGSHGEITPFFGRITRSSPLPSLLSRRTKCEVLALSLTSTRPGHWKARYLPVAKPPSTLHCMQALEQAMTTNLLDVFWLQNRWRCYLHQKRSFTKWLDPKTPRSSKPHRALLWLTEADDQWQLDEIWKHPDVDYELVLRRGQNRPTGFAEDIPVHQAPVQINDSSLISFFRQIDRSRPLPLDAVLGVSPPAKMRKICKRMPLDFVDIS